MTDQVLVTVCGEERTVASGTRLSDLLACDLPCGGHGKCGKCKVIAHGALSPLSDTERAVLTAGEIAQGVRLACRTTVVGPCTVVRLADTTKTSVLTDGAAVCTAVHPVFSSFGVAVDIGTTTVAARLFDKGGALLAQRGLLNPQETFGADVISRLEAADKGASRQLAAVLTAAIDKLVTALAADAGCDPRAVDGMVMTGNTAMLCLLTGTAPDGLLQAPFSLPHGFDETVTAGSLGLTAVAPATPVYLPPCISAFVGADTVCALLAADLCRPDADNAMLCDIGTNGEMALWHAGTLTVCSTAAGPAFEGVGISMGMRGGTGAIDRVTLQDGRLSAHVIGDGEPVGICGSGLIDAVACLLENETVDETGFLEEKTLPIAGAVSLTRRDIRMVQLAKSAICAGLRTLLHEAGVSAGSVTVLAIAGGFGTCLDRENAGRIGLLPPECIARTKAIGNAALDGAAMLLMNGDLRKGAQSLAQNAETVDLMTHPFFSDAYVNGMMFS